MASDQIGVPQPLRNHRAEPMRTGVHSVRNSRALPSLRTAAAVRNRAAHCGRGGTLRTRGRPDHEPDHEPDPGLLSDRDRRSGPVDANLVGADE